MKKSIFITLTAMLLLSSCMLTKNACKECVKVASDNIRSDTIYQTDTFVVSKQLEGATIKEFINYDTLVAATFKDSTTGLEVRIERITNTDTIIITATQPTRYITDTLYLESIVAINYKADIAKYQAQKDSLINRIAKLENKEAVKSKVKKWFQNMGFDYSKWFIWLWFALFLVSMYALYRVLKWVLSLFGIVFGQK